MGLVPDTRQRVAAVLELPRASPSTALPLPGPPFPCSHQLESRVVGVPRDLRSVQNQENCGVCQLSRRVPAPAPGLCGPGPQYQEEPAPGTRQSQLYRAYTQRAAKAPGHALLCLKNDGRVRSLDGTQCPFSTAMCSLSLDGLRAPRPLCPAGGSPSPLGPAVVMPSGQCAKGSGEQRVQGWEPGEQLLRERELEPDKCVRLVKEETQMLDLVWDYCKSIRLCGKVRP